MSPARKIPGLPWPVRNLMVRCASEDLTEVDLRQLAVLALGEMAKVAAPDEVPLALAAIQRVAGDGTAEDLRRLCGVRVSNTRHKP